MIQQADPTQLKELYGLITNYFNGSIDDEWHGLPDLHRKRIIKGLEQADAGLRNAAQGSQ